MKQLALFLALTLAVLLFALETRAETPSHEALTAWATANMLRWNPPGKSRFPGAVETAEEGRARYRAIADAAADVALATPLPGKRGAVRALALLLSVVFFESGMRRDVDLGGEEGPGGWVWFPHGRGDSGRSVCLGQIQVGAGKTAEGWDARALVGDRRKCLAASLRLIQRSVNACKAYPLGDWLSAYTTGRCKREEPSSRARVFFAGRMSLPPEAGGL